LRLKTSSPKEISQGGVSASVQVYAVGSLDVLNLRVRVLLTKHTLLQNRIGHGVCRALHSQHKRQFNYYDLLASAAKAAEIGSALGMAEAMRFQNNATADSSVARKTRSVGMTKLKT
jgi:hypothetical protein